MKAGRASAGIPAEGLLKSMLARSAPWALAAGLATSALVAVVDGLAAMAAALLGVLAVAIFYIADVVVLQITRRWHGAVTAAALLGEYVFKLLLFAWALWLLDSETEFDLTWLGVTVAVTTVTWVAAMTVVAMRTKSFYFDSPPR